MNSYSYDEFVRLRTAISEKYLLDQPSLLLILLGRYHAKNPFRPDVSYDTKKRRQELDRMRKYLSNPFVLLFDLHEFLYGNNKIEQGFIPDLKMSSYSVSPSKISTSFPRNAKP